MPLPRTLPPPAHTPVEASALHRALLEGVQDCAIYALDPEGRVLSWNAGAQRLKGYDADEIIGRDCAEFYEPDEVAAGRPRHHLRDAERSGRSEEEGWRRRKDGTRFWAHVVTTPLRDERGRLAGFAKVTRDLTERRAAESALRESEARFRRAFDDASIGMTITGADGRWLKVNRTLCTVLGYTPEEMLAGDFQSITHPEDLAMGLDVLRRALAGEIDRFEMEKRYIHKRGHPVSMSVNVVVVRDSPGAEPYFLAQMQDITERRRAEAALAASEATFRSLSASSPVGIFRSDASGGITYANPRVLQIFALLESEGLGSGWLARIHPDDRDAVITGWGAALATEAEYAHEYRLLMPDGTIRWVHCRAAPLPDAAGGMAGTVGTVEDVTERRALEAQLRHAQKMEAVGRLAGGVAHDFNNLLTIIGGNTAFVRSALEPDSQAASDLAQVELATQRAAALTRQLLAFSRKQVLQPRRVDVNETVRALEQMLGRLIGEDVVVESDLQADAWPVHADPGQLEQVLMNLVVNARDAMPGGGSIHIATCNVRLDDATAARHCGARAGDHLSLTVSDTGTGIPADVMPHIFEPFFTTKQLGKGTGLGLATVYGIVKQSGGHVLAESLPERGSRFTVLLPRDVTSTEGAAGGARAAARSGSETVLVVEDEQAVLGVIRRMLTRQGYQVLAAADGAEALRVWDVVRRGAEDAPAARIDLVLADLVMPVLGGRDLIERLRAESATVPIILMTGYTADAAGAQADLASGGASGFLQKPLSHDALLAEVRRVLDRQGQLR